MSLDAEFMLMQTESKLNESQKNTSYAFTTLKKMSAARHI